MKLKNKSIVVTGGAGFIGSHLVDALIKEESEDLVVVDNMFLGKDSNLKDAKKNYDGLTVYKKDAAQFETMKKIFEKHGTDVVFDLAVIPLPASLEKPLFCMNENIGITSTISELQRLDYFKTLVHFSSSEVYGTALYAPMDEKHPLEATTPYAASKAAGDMVVQSYRRTFNMDSAIVRPFNNFGPRQNEKSYAGVIPLTIKRIMNGESPIIFGDGNQTRDYIYVTETARMAIEVYKNEVTRGKIINIASGKETSILFLIKEIMNIMGCDSDIVFEKPRPADVRRHIANISLAENTLGFRQQIPLEEGLKSTVHWYKKNL
jgi:UDP-glucose 4-epimerase